MFMIQLGFLIVLTAVILRVSLPALRQPHSHGFTRAFAWEAIAILITINLRYWIIEPFSWRQLISWPLLILSLVMIVPAVRLFQTSGSPDPERDDDSALVGIEKTTQLVTTGLYRYIRHPFYASLIYLAWGAAFKLLTWLTIGLALTATILLVMTAWREERENIRLFGQAYQDYKQHTKMFIPYIF